MKPEQKAIYYITGNNEKNLRASPLLEAYKNKGFEVLIMADDIDDIVIPSLMKYKDFELKGVNRAGSDEELGIDKDEAKKKEEAASASVAEAPAPSKEEVLLTEIRDLLKK